MLLQMRVVDPLFVRLWFQLSYFHSPWENTHTHTPDTVHTHKPNKLLQVFHITKSQFPHFKMWADTHKKLDHFEAHLSPVFHAVKCKNVTEKQNIYWILPKRTRGQFNPKVHFKPPSLLSSMSPTFPSPLTQLLTPSHARTLGRPRAPFLLLPSHLLNGLSLPAETLCPFRWKSILVLFNLTLSLITPFQLTESPWMELGLGGGGWKFSSHIICFSSHRIIRSLKDWKQWLQSS